MAAYKFDGFVFDSITYRLTHCGKRVALRPKAAKLLKFLIQNRERVVAKSEIMSAVWQSRYARDHLLFQLISELRKSPLKSDFVRTQPNEGYQWNVQTKVSRVRVFPPFQRALGLATTALAATTLAAFAVCLMVFFTMPASTFTPRKADISRAESIRLPAHSAFSKGVVALEQEDNKRAAEWFKFALIENPESIESSLFLAETLLKQDKTAESFEYLQALLQKPGLGAYNKMSATDLLSHVRQRQGRLHEALRYAQQSGGENVVAQCSVDVVARRIEMLEGELGTPLVASTADPKADISDVAPDVHKLTEYQEQCSHLSPTHKETSYCVPDDTDGFYVGASVARVTDLV